MKNLLIFILISSIAQAQGTKVTFAGKTGGNISKEEFLHSSGLKITPRDKDLKIESYKISIANTDSIAGEDAYRVFKINNNQIPDKLVALIKKAGAGSTIFIEYIKVSRIGGDLQTMPSMKFALTN